MMEPQTLTELSLKIKEIIFDSFPFSVPVIAEISDLSINKNGNCYLELVEHDTEHNRIAARVRGIIFANRFQLIQSYFFSVTGHSIQAGIKVLVMVRVSYHEVYGLSVEVVDIDPKYTLGDLEQQKKLIIERLLQEGVVDMNKMLELPLVIRKIAIISSSTAAGYGDFVQHLCSNQFDFKFKIDLYEAYMQGQQTVNSIHTAIDAIFESGIDYDVIVIIRGGGSKMELAIFDHYDLAYLITQLPIPVFTGIGHDRDESVVDFVANNALKTPTAVANFILDHNKSFEEYLISLGVRLQNALIECLSDEYDNIENLRVNLYNVISHFYNLRKDTITRAQKKVSRLSLEFLHNKTEILVKLKSKLQYCYLSCFSAERYRLQQKKDHFSIKMKQFFITQYMLLQTKEQKIFHADPQNILDKGYAIVVKDGKKIKNVCSLNQDDKVRILFSKGSSWAQILKKEDK